MVGIKDNRSRTIRMPIAPLAAGLLGAFALAGCVSYTNVPEPESAPAFKSANHFQAGKVTNAALRQVIEQYPMRDSQGRYSVNLPVGTTLESAQEIIEGLPEGVVLPTEGMDESIPVYHIGRIWIRASTAKVDVLYPARSFDGTEYTGNVTVWLRGGLRQWREDRLQHWAPGTIEVPPIYVPLPKEVIEGREFDSDENTGNDASSTPGASEPVEQPEPEAEIESAPEPVPSDAGGDAQYRQVPIDD